MKRSVLLFLLMPLLWSSHSLAQTPDCACDNEALSNGLTGNEIVEIVCPDGNLGSESEYFYSSDGVYIALIDFPHTDYSVDENNVGDKFCSINTDGVLPVTLQISDTQYGSCRERLSEACNLFALISPPIPTVSEWGLTAMAVILGIIGFIVIRRRKVAV